jgi:DNA-binding LacI/PurR family transcriptional regulator
VTSQAAQRPTITDVARLAGVSVASVSRVLRDEEPVTVELRERVERAAAELEYKPHRVHRKPANQPWLVVLVGEQMPQFDVEVMAHIQEFAEQRGWLTNIIRLTDGPEQLRGVLERLRPLSLAGIASISVSVPPAEWIRAAEHGCAPIVVLNTLVNHPRVASIMVDFEEAGARVGQHLLDLGHRRIIYLGSYDDPISAGELKGLRKALSRRGISYPPDYELSIPYTPEGASQGVSRILGFDPGLRPTAIFAFDDSVAIDVLNVLRYYGQRVPEDISVVGFDNIRMAAHTYPALTTIDLPKRRIGMLMVQLIEELQKRDAGTHTGAAHSGAIGATIIDGPLLVRESTGPAPRNR